MSIGQVLQQTRKHKGLTLSEVASKTLLQKQYLKALESDDFSGLPSQTHYLGMVKRYALFLKIDYRYLIDNYKMSMLGKEEFSVSKQSWQEQESFSKGGPLRSFRGLSRLVGVIVGLLILWVGWFFLGHYQALTGPPALALAMPVEGVVYYDNQVIVAGQVEEDAQVFINGQLVSQDANGSFSSQYIVVKSGWEQVEVVARNTLSGEETKLQRRFAVDLPGVNQSHTQNQMMAMVSQSIGQVTTASKKVSQTKTVVVRVTERVWLQLAVDGQNQEQFILQPGESRLFEAQSGFSLRSGKAYATFISWPGQEEFRFDSVTVAEKDFDF